MNAPITAFLSHRYKSPEVNLRFFQLFSAVAQVQFSVDYGDLATNVTRLEYLIRDADAFIGIYPLGVEASAKVTPEEARKQSRYFRLELDLAVRAGVPAIVFADERYGDVLDCPSWIPLHTFDVQQINASGDGRRLQTYAKAIQEFCQKTLAYQSYSVHEDRKRTRNKYALLLPPQPYGPELRQRLKEALQAEGRSVVDLGWPPRLGTEFYRSLGDIDVVVLDLGQSSDSSVIAGFLHGHFVPAIRLAHQPNAEGVAPTAVSNALFGNFEVGYVKDIVAWTTEEQLLLEFRSRLETLLTPQQLIGDDAKARDYFNSASLRKEVIFVSYAGADVELARPVIAALKQKFKTVFDYKDGESIKPGRRWLEEIFNSIDRSAAAMILLSPNYLASKNCVHEAQQIVAREDEGKLAVLPLRLSDDAIDTPAWLKSAQHARLPQLDGPGAVPGLVIDLLPKPQ